MLNIVRDCLIHNIGLTVRPNNIEGVDAISGGLLYTIISSATEKTSSCFGFLLLAQLFIFQAADTQHQ